MKIWAACFLIGNMICRSLARRWNTSSTKTVDDDVKLLMCAALGISLASMGIICLMPIE
jgi:hypothetical protein